MKRHFREIITSCVTPLCPMPWRSASFNPHPQLCCVIHEQPLGFNISDGYQTCSGINFIRFIRFLRLFIKAYNFLWKGYYYLFIEFKSPFYESLALKTPASQAFYDFKIHFFHFWFCKQTQIWYCQHSDQRHHVDEKDQS